MFHHRTDVKEVVNRRHTGAGNIYGAGADTLTRSWGHGKLGILPGQVQKKVRYVSPFGDYTQEKDKVL